MSIQEFTASIKGWFYEKDGALVLIIIVVAVGSFWLGRVSVTDFGISGSATTGVVLLTDKEAAESVPVNETSPSEQNVSSTTVPVSQPMNIEKNYVASKKGTKYHLPWCSGAQAIKEENKIWFTSKADAEAAGYTPAANCKGI